MWARRTGLPARGSSKPPPLIEKISISDGMMATFASLGTPEKRRSIEPLLLSSTSLPVTFSNEMVVFFVRAVRFPEASAISKFPELRSTTAMALTPAAKASLALNRYQLLEAPEMRQIICSMA